MKIEENVLLDELNVIFDENNQNYISDKKCIYDSNFLKVVAVENEHAVGYAVLYFGNDFIEKENFPVNLEVKGKLAYIWNCVTKRGYENRGIQTSIFNYFIKKFNDYDIYSVVDIFNTPSRRLHEKTNFEFVVDFKKEFDGELCKFNLLKHSSKKNYIG